MAFFDKMKAAAKTAGSYALSQAEELQNYRNQYSALSDEALIRKFKSSSGARKVACAALIKERGLHLD